MPDHDQPPGAPRGPAPTSRARAAVRRLAPLLVPALAALLAHGPGVNHQFTGDDDLLILRNPQITEASTLRQLLLTDWWDTGSRATIGYYRPVTKASFRANYALSGPAPRPFHATNIALHVLAALALASLAVRLLGPALGGLAGALFAVHPSTVEAVAVVTARSDVLAGLFFLAALLAAARAYDRHPWRAGALSAALALLAYGSKESSLLLTAAVIALGLALSASPRRIAALAGAHVAALAAFALLRSFVTLPQTNPEQGTSPALMATSALTALAEYLYPLVGGRHILFLPKAPTTVADPRALAGLLALLAALALLVRARGRTPAAFALVVAGAGLAPVLAVWLLHAPMGRGELVMADRWLYLPSAGVALLAAAALSRVRLRVALAVGSAAALLLLALATIRTAAYASPESYMAYTVEAAHARGLERLSPFDRYLVLVYEAKLLKDAGDLEAARQKADEALRTDPWGGDAWKQAADIAYRQGRHADAEAAIVRLLSPEFARGMGASTGRTDVLSRMDRAPLLLLLGRARGAQEKWDPAAQAFLHAAAVLAQRGEREAAAAALLDAADCLERAGRRDEAARAVARARALAPGAADAAP